MRFPIYNLSVDRAQWFGFLQNQRIYNFFLDFRSLTVTTVVADKDTLVRDMGRITIGGSAWLVVPATVAARKQSAVLVVVANHGRGQENTVRAKG